MTDNELIAEFMGLKKDSDNLYLIYEYSAGRASSLFAIEHLAYNTSWDWLMPVVEKINKVYNGAELDTREGQWAFDKVLDTRVNSELKFVYDTIVEFIKWYNSNKNP